MKTKRIRVAAFALWGLVAVAPGCVKEDGGGESYVAVGDPLPALPVPGYIEEVNVFGAAPWTPQRFDTRTLEGKKTLIYFFWVGCPSCRQTTPHVLEAWTQLRTRGDVRLVCIARGGSGAQEGRQDAVGYWQGLAPSIDPAPMPPLFYDTDRKVFHAFAEAYVPRFYLADAEGVVRWEQVGEISSAAALTNQIDKF